MKWFVAVLVMECRVGRDRAELWDEQIRLIRAVNPEDAYQKALTLGKSDHTEWKNSSGQTVRWRFVGLGELQELLDRHLRSGTEVFSTLSRSGRPSTVPKRKLNVFWTERNLDKTAAELLPEELRPFAPR